MDLGLTRDVRASYVVDSYDEFADLSIAISCVHYAKGQQHKYIFVTRGMPVDTAQSKSIYCIDHKGTDPDDQKVIVINTSGKKLLTLKSTKWVMRINTGYNQVADDAVRLACQKLTDAGFSEVADKLRELAGLTETPNNQDKLGLNKVFPLKDEKPTTGIPEASSGFVRLLEDLTNAVGALSASSAAFSNEKKARITQKVIQDCWNLGNDLMELKNSK